MCYFCKRCRKPRQVYIKCVAYSSTVKMGFRQKNLVLLINQSLSGFTHTDIQMIFQDRHTYFKPARGLLMCSLFHIAKLGGLICSGLLELSRYFLFFNVVSSSSKVFCTLKSFIYSKIKSCLAFFTAKGFFLSNKKYS